MAKKQASKTAERFTIHKAPCSWRDSLGRVNPGEHGTRSQRDRALRVGATPCAACKAAASKADVEWRRKNAGRKPSAHKKPEAKVLDHTEALKRKQGPQSKGTGKARRVG